MAKSILRDIDKIKTARDDPVPSRNESISINASTTSSSGLQVFKMPSTPKSTISNSDDDINSSKNHP